MEQQQNKWTPTTYRNLLEFTNMMFSETREDSGEHKQNGSTCSLNRTKLNNISFGHAHLGNYKHKIEIVILGEDIGISSSMGVRLEKGTYLVQKLLVAFSFLNRIVDALIIF